MRTLIVFSLVAIATAIGGAGAGSGALEQAPRTPPIVVSYNLRATFNASMLVSWGEKQGDRSQDCAAWGAASGLNKVTASTVKPIKGSLQIFRRGPDRDGPPPPWGTLVAVGKAVGGVERTRDEQLGVNWGASCVGTRPQPYKWPPSICGERPFTSDFSALTASWRVFGTLERGKSDPDPAGGDPLGGLSHRSIDFSVVPRAIPLPMCPMPSAKALIEDVGLLVSDADLSALRALKRGRSYELSHRYGGRCTESSPARVCAFVLNLSVTIKRTT